jgi:hypothetical protein
LLTTTLLPTSLEQTSLALLVFSGTQVMVNVNMLDALLAASTTSISVRNQVLEIRLRGLLHVRA